MLIERDLLIREFCALSSDVMERVYGYAYSSDCFCDNYDEKNFQFDSRIFDYIKDAVDEKIEKDNEGNLQ